MCCTFGLGHSLQQSVSQRQVLSLEQRQYLKVQLFCLQLELVGVLRDEKYEPRAQCSRCERQLTAVEILGGFLDDPTDFTTECPVCHHRFRPMLISFSDASQIELQFFCESQVLAMLPQFSELSPEQLSREQSAIYRSAIIHHGSLRQAFGKIDIDYQHETIHGWQNVVMPFLGKLQDTTIAGAAGITVAAVRYLRRKHGIDRFSQRKSAEEAGIF